MSKRLSTRKKLRYSAFVLVPALLGLEVAVRVYRGEVFTLRSTRSDPVFRRDPLLGWTNLEDAVVGRPTDPKGVVETDALGLRLSHSPYASQPPRVLAVGCSVTFGDEVKDTESWPAQLEASRGVRVLNGGVDGYGLGQTVLRAEALLKQVQVEWVVLTLIPDHLRRTECSSIYGKTKPVFRPDWHGGLELHPPRDDWDEIALRRALGQSRLLDLVMQRTGLLADWRAPVRDNPDGTQVMCLLLDRLEAAVEAAHAHLLVVYFYYPGFYPTFPLLYHNAKLNPVLSHIRALGVPLLDAGAALGRKLKTDRAFAHGFHRPSWHLSRLGNAWLAGMIAAELARQGFTFPGSSADGQ